MKAGDKIKIQNTYGTWEEYVVEEFRYCLGVFMGEDYREAGCFAALCDLYTDGPDSEVQYISNFGAYGTNQVPAWADIPK